MRNHKAIFEREVKPSDNFGAAVSTWEEVTREWIGLDQASAFFQRREFQDAAQTKGTQALMAKVTHGRTMASVDIACRMKIAKDSVVNEQEPNADENFRIFGIESITNVREANRELHLIVTERV